MKAPLTLFLPLLLLSVGAANAGVINTYSNESTFLSDILPSYYKETFGKVNLGTSLSYSGSGYGYTVSGGALHTTYGWLQDSAVSDTLTITFTSGAVTAIGGNFFSVNTWAQPRGTTVTLSFSDGTTRSFASTTSTTTFTGYTFNAPISRMIITAASSGLNLRWEAMDNLVIGTANPEPGTWVLLGAGAGLLAVLKRKRR